MVSSALTWAAASNKLGHPFEYSVWLPGGFVWKFMFMVEYKEKIFENLLLIPFSKTDFGPLFFNFFAR